MISRAILGSELPQSIKKFAFALLLSGFAALCYQVVWQRVLTQMIGSDAISVTLIVTIFMICLGCGAELAKYLLARSRSQALILYSIIEVLVGICGVFSVSILRWVNTNFSNITENYLPGDFLLNLGVLSVPIIGMGLTTPLIVHVAKESLENIGRTVGTLYAWNIAGAAIGSALTGLILIEVFGLDQTAKIAAALNIIAAVVAVTLLKEVKANKKEEEKTINNNAAFIPLSFIVTAILFGFGTLAIQVIFFRILSNYLTLSTIVFPMMLCAYLCLMSFGQYIGGNLADRFSSQLYYVVVGLFSAGSILFLAALKFPSSWAASIGALRFSSFNGQLISDDYPELIGDPSPITALLFSLLIMISVIPWTGLFPVMFRLITDRIEIAGNRFARIYSLYTVGNVIGAFVCGIFMLPIIGTGRSAILTILIVGIGVIILLLHEGNKKYFYQKLSVSIIGIFTAFLIPTDYYSKAFNLGKYNVIDVFEGQTGVATVVPTSRFYTIIDMNRTASASAMNANPQTLDVYQAWRWNHTELMAFDHQFRPQEILIIGIGHAYLIYAMLDLPFVKKITVVDISEEVTKAVKKYTTTSVKKIFTDPRVEIVIADGRRYVQSAIKKGQKFDLIQNKINEPWHAGSSNLFTEEFFAEEKSLLRPGGYLSTRPLIGHLTDGLKIFGNAIWGGYYHMYFKNGKVIEPKSANITEDIQKAWFASLPGIDDENRILRNKLSITIFNNVPAELKTDPNTDDKPTFEYYFLRKLLGTWISPRVEFWNLDLKKYTIDLPVRYTPL